MSRQAYFDSVAPKWDNWNEREKMEPRLIAGLRRFELGADERILDLGCGTGILLQHVLVELGDGGRVIAVDFSEEMLQRARRKFTDGRVRFEQREATDLPVEDASIDRVLCFSTWPHFPDPEAVLREVERVLVPGGHLHIWHLASKEMINSIHSGVGGLLGEDLLVPATELVELGEKVGFVTEKALDESDEYLVVFRKAA